MFGRRLLPLALVVIALAVAPGGGAAPAPSWAQADIRVVVSHGLLATDVASFRPDDVLTRAELAELRAAIEGTVPAAVARPDDPVTVAALDASLVRALGLSDTAASFTRTTKAAGIAVPAHFGTEVVARMLSLRPNHPMTSDRLELLPGDPVPSAEAAYSVARILRFRGYEVESVRSTAATYAPVPPTDQAPGVPGRRGAGGDPPRADHVRAQRRGGSKRASPVRAAPAR